MDQLLGHLLLKAAPWPGMMRSILRLLLGSLLKDKSVYPGSRMPPVPAPYVCLEVKHIPATGTRELNYTFLKKEKEISSEQHLDVHKLRHQI